MICSNCGNKNKKRDKYCEKCGTLLVEEKSNNKDEFICKKCHTKNDSNSAFCIKCGEKLGNSEVNSKNSHESKKVFLIIGIITAILLVLFIVLYFAVFYRKTYNLEDVIDINVVGYDGYAKITVEPKTSTKVEDILNDAYFDISKTENIKNGDIITITIRYNEEKAKKEKVIITESYQYVVDGLEKGNVLDLFKDAKIDYSNKSPYLKINITNETIDLNKYRISYKVESLDKDKSNYEIKNGFFKNGEKIKIVATYDEQLLGNDGFIIQDNFKELEIPQQDSFIRNKDQLNSEMIKKINEEMIKDIKEYATPSVMKRIYCNHYYCSDYSGASIRESDYALAKDPEKNNIYIGYKDSVQSGSIYDSAHTSIVGTYTLTFDDKNPNKIKPKDGTAHVYCVVHYDNLYIKSDGTISEYEKNDNYVSCTTFTITESHIKTQYITGRYQYSELITIE